MNQTPHSDESCDCSSRIIGLTDEGTLLFQTECGYVYTSGETPEQYGYKFITESEWAALQGK